MNMWNFIYGNDRKKKNKKTKKQTKLKKENLPKKSFKFDEEHTKSFIAKAKKLSKKTENPAIDTVTKSTDTVEKTIKNAQVKLKNQVVETNPVLLKIIETLKEELQEAYTASFFVTDNHIQLNDNIKVEQALSLAQILTETDKLLVSSKLEKIKQYAFLVLNNGLILFMIKLKNDDLHLLLNQNFLNLGYLISILIPKINNIKNN